MPFIHAVHCWSQQEEHRSSSHVTSGIMSCLRVLLWSDELHGLSHLLFQKWYTLKDAESSWLAVWLAISTPNRCNGIVHKSPGPCVTFVKLDGFLIYCTFPHGYISKSDKRGKWGGEAKTDTRKLNVCLSQNNSLVVSAEWIHLDQTKQYAIIICAGAKC